MLTGVNSVNLSAKQNLVDKLVFIHVDSLKREYSSAWLLGKELRLAGCKVHITSRLSINYLCGLFCPDILILSHTFTISNKMKNSLKAQGALIYVNIVEEVVNDNVYMEIFYRKSLEIEKFDGIFVWSAWAKNWLIEKRNLNASQVHVIGSIRNSVIYSMNKSFKKTGAIGVIARFEGINTWNSTHPFTDLIEIDVEDPEDVDGRFYLEKKIIDCETFALTAKVVRDLTSRGRKVIIRPHPNESRKIYSVLKEKFGENCEIDDSVDMCHFLSKCDVVIGPSSSAYVEAYLLEIPIVSLHAIQQNHYTSLEVQESLDLMSKGAYLPKNTSDAIELCLKSKLEPIISDEVNEFLEVTYSMKKNPNPINNLLRTLCDDGINRPKLKKLKNFAVGPFHFFIDFLFLVFSFGWGQKSRRFSVLYNYHYNLVLHRPNSFMKSLRFPVKPN